MGVLEQCPIYYSVLNMEYPLLEVPLYIRSISYDLPVSIAARKWFKVHINVLWYWRGLFVEVE